MAEEFETIDGIARRLNRDVYYLALFDDAGDYRDIYTDISEATEWLDAHQIGWRLCSGFSEDTVWLEGGPGCIFLDIHPETAAEEMQRVEAHFMKSDGSPAVPGFVPAVLRIDDARQFAYRDDPNYWEKF